MNHDQKNEELVPTFQFPMNRADHVMGLESDLMEADIARRMYNPKLTALRAQNHGLPIAQMTNKTATVLLVMNVVSQINIPSGTKMVRFNSDGFFMCSRNGNAQLPVPSVYGAADNESGSFIPQFDTFYYIEEVKQISLISDLPVRVSLEYFAQI